MSFSFTFKILILWVFDNDDDKSDIGISYDMMSILGSKVNPYFLHLSYLDFVNNNFEGI